MSEEEINMYNINDNNLKSNDKINYLKTKTKIKTEKIIQKKIQNYNIILLKSGNNPILTDKETQHTKRFKIMKIDEEDP